LGSWVVLSLVEPVRTKKEPGCTCVLSHFAAVAEVEVGAIEALMTNTDDRSLIATIAGDAIMDDWARLAGTTVAVEWIHGDDGASRGDGLGDKLEGVIESRAVNCVRGMNSRTLATLKNGIDAEMSAIYRVRPR
jgi:hypothetical protein